jgi:hypothetical protein
MMNVREYVQMFDSILGAENPFPPYNKPDYINYVKLNQSRMARWSKTLQLNPDLIDTLNDLEESQHWIMITEPWCGDAAHSIPFLAAIAEQSPKITYEIQLRDSDPFLINNYLTHGGKSIPKLIVRDLLGTDLFTWGPRPAASQELFNLLKSNGAQYDEITVKLQAWYNADKGQSIQKELLTLIVGQTV